MARNDHGFWRTAWNDAASATGVDPDIQIRVVAGLRSPAVWVGQGVWLLIPAEAVAWSTDVCRRVCLHEAGHVAGRDAWLHRVWLVIDVLQWWNPLWWGLRARMELELEKLADGCVVRGDRGDSREYVRDLLDCVESGMRGVASWGGSGGLEERVSFLLRPQRVGDGWGAWLAMVLAALSVVGLAILFRGPAPARMDAALVRDAEWRMAANPFPATAEAD
jgi:beta-lactamase regulating signal transducer with metallopeptidase domain